MKVSVTIAALLFSTVAFAQDAQTAPPSETCDSVEAVKGFVAKTNEANGPILELTSIDGKSDKAGDNSASVARAVWAFNTAFQSNYSGEGLLILHATTNNAFVVGLLEEGGTKACAVHKMTADEFQALAHLISDPAV